MAKVLAPLFSFEASGALAKSLVYFPWKGLNAVRQYVVPANPNTSAQATQRSYLKDLLPLLHAQESDATDPFDSDDMAAYTKLASLAATPRTWFNALCKRWIDCEVAGATPLFYAHQRGTPGTGAVTVSMQMVKKDTDIFPTSGTIYWGTSKSSMFNTEAVATITDGAVSQEVSSLASGTKY